MTAAEPQDISLRPATEADQESIQALVRAAHINPTGLNWQRFSVAATPVGEVIGCAQLKPHGDGSTELASLAVDPAYQGQGIGSALVHRLINQHHGPLYLTCRSRLGEYYQRFGFRKIELEEMPPYFRRISRLASVLEALRMMGEQLWVMKREEGETQV